MTEISGKIEKKRGKRGKEGKIEKESRKGNKKERERGRFFFQNCRDPGSNRGPLDLQGNALPTELSRLPYHIALLA